MSQPDPGPAAPPGRLAPAPFAQAVAEVDGAGRVRAVAAAPAWPHAGAVARWTGRTLSALLDAPAAEAIAAGREAEAVVLLDGETVALAVAPLPLGGILRLHLRDRSPEAALQAHLSRALSALHADRREERALDARHRALLHAMPDAVAVVDATSGRVIEMTGAAARLLGASPQGQAGGAFAQWFESGRRGFLDALRAAALAGGDAPVRAVLRDGRGGVSIDAVVHRAGDEAVLICRMRRAGEGREARRASGLAAVAAAARDGIACLDADGRVAQANAAFVAMAGVPTPFRLIGRSLAPHLLRGAIDLGALIGPDRPPCLSTAMVAPDGRRLPVEIAATALGGGGTGLVARDLTLASITRGPPQPQAGLIGATPLRDIVGRAADEAERAALDGALALTAGNRAAAATLLGLSRQALYVKLRRHGLSERDAR